MGVRGLTTFIQNRSHLYMEKYELHDTPLVVDGNSVACQLYKWHCKSNDCFGGDYDIYGKVIIQFFQILSECKVIPYVIFDGGYENRKVATVISRMKNKIKSAEQLNGVTESSISVFPLFLRETFLDIVHQLRINTVRCDFEGDTETANIARNLNCPVLSYDSDYFIFDVLYIPFSTFEMTVKKGNSYKYIPCEVYKVEKFLHSFEGLDKSILPILAVLLGNDYVKRGVFSMFYQNLKRQKGQKHQSDQQKVIKSLLVWLQNETKETAITKVLSRYKCENRKRIVEKIQNAIKGYNCYDSKYLKYLGISPMLSVSDESNINVNLNNGSEEDLSSIGMLNNIDEDSDQEDSESDDSTEEDRDLIGSTSYELPVNLPTIFVEKFRQCLYPSCFMDILVQNKYYCIPQVENSSSDHSHTCSLEILSAIHKILTNSNKNLFCIARFDNRGVGRQEVPYFNNKVPSLMEIQATDIPLRRDNFAKVLRMEKSFFIEHLLLFPESWRIFIITLKYLIDRSVISWPFIYSLALCKIILNYVDIQIGFYRSTKNFSKVFHAKLKNISDPKILDFKETILENLNEISYNDSILCMKNCISYFEMDIKLSASNRLFDRDLVHSISQFQSCLLHIKYLNNIFNLPYANFLISECLNSTFVYNFTKNLSKRANIDQYIGILLKNSPTVLHSLNLVIGKIREFASDNIPCTKPVRRKKKKKKLSVDNYEQIEGSVSEEECIYDSNNRFAVLSNL